MIFQKTLEESGVFSYLDLDTEIVLFPELNCDQKETEVQNNQNSDTISKHSDVKTLEDAIRFIVADIELFLDVLKRTIDRSGGLAATESEDIFIVFKKENVKFKNLCIDHIPPHPYPIPNNVPRDIIGPIIKNMIADLYPSIFSKLKSKSWQGIYNQYTKIKSERG